MLVKITNADCGLIIGKEYDLVRTSAMTLVQKNQAVIVTKPALAPELLPDEQSAGKKAKKTSRSRSRK